ncbi:MAG: fibronectin type III domain-containing protein [Eubacterium sp.]|nr:fibronectin type III domain-containing protein [Eubacterium sp.]
MFKKTVSLIMCLIITAGAFALPVNVFAKSYKQQLIDKGFPESYVDELVALHNKYPNWTFKPFETELDWQDAVDGERSPASKQIYNGSTASETVVKYYMDPRNWLNETSIYQFESVKYSSSQNKSGVEAIIASTWMKNSDITYNSTESKKVTYKNSNGKTVKYSTAILDAAENSGLSSYYLASKIVKEVGSKEPTAGGTCGTRIPFTGIYNYYSIGAYSGAMDGLQWASGFLKAKKATVMYPEYDSEKKTVKGKASAVASGKYMSYISSAGNYYKVKLYNETSSGYTKDGAIGYVLKEDCNTKYFTYGRPWTNPYKSIYNGALYIANGYLKYQYTGYLQKFNVNKDSPSLYAHEYMTNVDGAQGEAAIKYRAYKNAGIVSGSTTFYIPVFKNMPKENCKLTDSSPTPSNDSKNRVKGLTLDSRTKTSLTYKWDKFSGATKYYVHITNLTKGTTFDKTVTTNSATLKGLTAANNYSVKVRAYTSKGWSDYSTPNVKHCLPEKTENLKVKSVGDTSVKLSWTAMPGADGYYIYSYDSSKKTYKKLKTVDDPNASSATVGSLKSAASHTLCISAFIVDSKTKEGAKSSKVTAKTKLKKVTLNSLSSPSKTKIKASWSAASGNETGYEIWYARDKKFKKVVAKKFITSKKTTSYTGKNFTKGVTYYIKVRTYKTVDKKKEYGAFSNIKSVKSK